MKGKLWFLFAKNGYKWGLQERPFIAIWHQRSRRERPPKPVPDKQTMFANSFLSGSRESFRTSQNLTLHQDPGAYCTCQARKS